MVTAESAFAQKQGSGVVVGPGRVVTNSHVIELASRVRVARGKDLWSAQVVGIHPSADLAELSVPGLIAETASMRSSAELLRTGERVFAIGAPQGLELTMSDGLISALRSVDGGSLVQTTAAISPGSSGGGLFDERAHLVGITTFKLREGESLNFALPSAWLSAIRAVPNAVAAGLTAASSMPPRDAPGPPCALDSSGNLAPSEMAKLTIATKYVLPKTLTLDIENGSQCTVGSLTVRIRNTKREYHLSQSNYDPLAPGGRRMFRNEYGPAEGWDRVEWELATASSGR